MVSNHFWTISVLMLVSLLSGAVPVVAQEEEDAAVLSPAQPDFTLVALPTRLRLPQNRSAFRVTHRFLRPLGQGDFGDLLEDFFGLDSGAQIGLEFRYGLLPNTQVGVHRTSDKTISLFAEYDVSRQSEGMPFGIAAWGSIDGTNNFKDSYSPALGAVVSTLVSQYAAFYAQPMWINNSNPDPSELVDDNDTFIIGLGTRLRIRPTVYVVAEWVPRVAGYDPDVDHAAFAIEKRAGGHMFQLTFSNSVGTTMGQLARGALDNDNWYLGFAISRKFY
jgi:hypothetical protein